jgi:uncharacterized protein
MSEEISTNGQEATATAETATIAPGLFGWWELGTTDVEGAKAFYGAVFGWTYFDAPMEGNDFVYTTFLRDGKSVGACYKMMAEQVSQGIPPHWLSYVNVVNCDEATAKAQTGGGTVLAPPMDVMDFVRISVVMDPTGATFGILQPKAHTGAQLINEVGSFCWTELATKNVEAAKTFYSSVFNWNPETSDFNGMQYTQFKNGDKTAGGCMEITPEWGEMPSHWAAYVNVENCDATAAKVTDNGGTIVVPPQDIPTVGRFCIARDPQGAHVCFIQLLPMS